MPTRLVDDHQQVRSPSGDLKRGLRGFLIDSPQVVAETRMPSTLLSHEFVKIRGKHAHDPPLVQASNHEHKD